MLERLSLSNLTYDIDDFGCGQSKINALNMKWRFCLRDGLNREERSIFSFNGIWDRLLLETNRTSSVNFFLLFLLSPNVHFWPMAISDPDHNQVSWTRAMWLRKILVEVLSMKKSNKNESVIFQNQAYPVISDSDSIMTFTCPELFDVFYFLSMLSPFHEFNSFSH